MGICCCLSVKLNNKKVYLPSYPCKYLDKETKKCTIYERRHGENPECKDISTLYFEGSGVPPDCNYESEYNFDLGSRIAKKYEEKLLIKKLRKQWKKQGNKPSSIE